MKFADLHVHTSYSDSTFSPEQVVACAKEKALSAIAICDHDSIDGIGHCIAAAKEDIEIIPGIEMSSEKADAEVHMLGYFLDWKQAWLQRKLKIIREARIERLYKMIDKLKEYGLVMDAEEVLQLAGNDSSVGRMHLAQVMLKTGKVKSFKEAFDKYIGFLKPCYVSYTKLTPQESIEVILKAGGVPVIAHPDLMHHDEYIEEFVGYGLKGIEVYHTDHKPHAIKRYEEMAKRLGLLMTGGSDCHGMGKGRILMGTVRVSYDLVEKLRNEANRIRVQ